MGSISWNSLERISPGMPSSFPTSSLSHWWKEINFTVYKYQSKILLYFYEIPSDCLDQLYWEPSHLEHSQLLLTAHFHAHSPSSINKLTLCLSQESNVQQWNSISFYKLQTCVRAAAASPFLLTLEHWTWIPVTITLNMDPVNPFLEIN